MSKPAVKQALKILALTSIQVSISFWIVATWNLPESNRSSQASCMPIYKATPVAFWSEDGPAQDDHGDTEIDSAVLDFLNNYCLECHTGDDSEGDVALDKFSTIKQVLGDTETWAMVSEALDEGYMPPKNASQPKVEELAATKQWIKTTFANSANQSKPERMVRRMNQQEYIKTVLDLLRLPPDSIPDSSRIVVGDKYFDPESGIMPGHVMAISHQGFAHRLQYMPGISGLPIDPPVEHGFSNDQSQLSLSPLLMERFLEFGSSIVNSPNFEQRSELGNSLFAPFPNSDSLDIQLSAAKSRLRAFLERAFRRPVTETEISRYMALLKYEIKDGASFTDAMKTTVSAVLASPKFLYRLDIAETNSEMETADDFAMASRLSYFLWGTMPDDLLIQAAREGRLNSEKEIKSQIRRMMASKKIKSLSYDFGMQWLRLSKVYSAAPDTELFPFFYRKGLPPPSVAMAIEQMLLFESILVEDRSILEFINADYGYLNYTLMKWYGLDPVKLLGFAPAPDNYEDFFKIKWPDTHRGGIVTSGAMLLSTSTTNRTSPVFRGAWILDVVFNRPPPPPPADIPPLDKAGHDADKPLNFRDKLKIHREDPACATCHDRIDPLGFALEQYDAVGMFRDKYRNGAPINSTGELYGIKFNSASQFKGAIIRNRAKFVRAFVEHMMKYALGRKIHVSDHAEIERITQHVIDNDFRFSEVVQQVALSKAFRAGLPPIARDIPKDRLAKRPKAIGPTTTKNDNSNTKPDIKQERK